MDTTDAPYRPGAALAALRAGHQRFRAGISTPPTSPGPVAAIFACADPQLEPAILFGGVELFTVRTAGLTVGPAVLSSIEYAVEQLCLPLVVVLGHEPCPLSCGDRDARVRPVIAALRHRSPLLDQAVRAGRCAIHGMCWHDAGHLLKPVRRTNPPPRRRPLRLRPPARIH